MTGDLHPDDRTDATEAERNSISTDFVRQPQEADKGGAEPKANGLDRQAEIDRLAALPGPQFDLIDYKAEAKRIGLGTGDLRSAVKRVRDANEAPEKARAKAAADAAKAAAKAEADAIKAKEKADKAKAAADAKAAKARDSADKEAVKARERVRKASERQARLDAQKTTTLVDDDGDPLREWVPPDPATLPEITVAGGERPAIADAALVHMKAGRVPFYQRGKELVRVCLIKLKRSNGETILVPAISPVTKPMLLRAMGLCAKWLTFDKHNDLVQIDPPSDLADHILGMIGEWPFPPLRGVIATQTMRYDGTLLTEPGYDRATGLVLFNPPEMAPIPLRPTQQDAREARAILHDLLTEVAFAKDANVSLCGAVSMIMTLVLRGMMEVAPMHVVNKPAPNSGGSYLQDIAAAIAIGGPCPVLSLTLHNDEENEKRLSAAALSGQPIIAIDNFVGTLMGSFLCQLVERPMPQVRLLGKSEMVTIDNNHSVLSNGNNATIAADMVRRTLQISLDPNMENPETRTFTRNPVAEVMADRGKYIRAALIIARAFRVAGMPNKLPARNSFENWSDNVRSALHWLGWPDCDESIKAVRAADPAGAELHGVIAAWATDLKVGQGYLTSELITAANECLPYTADRIRPDLRDALFTVAGDKNGQLDGRALGRWLEAHLNRVVADHKLLVDRTNKARPRWSLAPR